jgi:hypothetical protein
MRLFTAILAVIPSVKDAEKKEWLRRYGLAYGFRKNSKNRRVAVETYIKLGYIYRDQTRLFSHDWYPAEGKLTVARLRKPGKHMNTFQVMRQLRG